MGRAITTAFIASDAIVVSSYVVDSEVEQLKKESKSVVELIKADVTKEQEVEKLVSNIISKHGRIHVLVNVVGGYLGGKSVSGSMKKSGILMMTMNLKSAFLISKHVIPQMVSSKYGKIMHVSSRTGLKSSGYDSAYAVQNLD